MKVKLSYFVVTSCALLLPLIAWAQNAGNCFADFPTPQSQSSQCPASQCTITSYTFNIARGGQQAGLSTMANRAAAVAVTRWTCACGAFGCNQAACGAPQNFNVNLNQNFAAGAQCPGNGGGGGTQ